MYFSQGRVERRLRTRIATWERLRLRFLAFLDTMNTGTNRSTAASTARTGAKFLMYMKIWLPVTGASSFLASASASASASAV